MIRELYREYIALPSEEDEPITYRAIAEFVLCSVLFVLLMFFVTVLSVVFGG